MFFNMSIEKTIEIQIAHATHYGFWIIELNFVKENGWFWPEMPYATIMFCLFFVIEFSENSSFHTTRTTFVFMDVFINTYDHTHTYVHVCVWVYVCMYTLYQWECVLYFRKNAVHIVTCHRKVRPHRCSIYLLSRVCTCTIRFNG